MAALCGAASGSADPTISGKEAEARQVLAQIQQIDRSLGAAVEAYNLANVRLGTALRRAQKTNTLVGYSRLTT